MARIYLVKHESCNNGEVTFDATPCETQDVARKVLDRKAEQIIHLSNYASFDPDDLNKEFCQEGDFIMEREGSDYFYITDKHLPNYEHLNIVSKVILKK